MTTTQHSSFTIERLLPGRPAHAYRFWADPALKQRWSGCHPDWTVLEQLVDFRIGGQEMSRLRTPEGTVHGLDIRYLDLLEGRRIVYAYAMQVNQSSISASLVTIELLPHGQGTNMVYTEHLVMIDGDPTQRRDGTEQGFDRLVLEVERDLAVLQ